MPPQSVNLHFKKLSGKKDKQKHPREGLSALVKAGKYLFLAGDEGASLERLKKTKKGFSKHKTFSLGDYIPLSGKEQSEIDIEGLDFENHYLWVAGSHSLKRKQPQEEDSRKEQIKDLSRVIAEPNRFILARIPLVKNRKTGKYTLKKTCPHPDHPGKKLTAARLTGHKKTNRLMKALQKDKHLKHFLSIPGKDNGLDIEGLALDRERLFLGLRGPVLRGWAMVLEIKTKKLGKRRLGLKKIGSKGLVYKKHFLDLSGMGIRDITPAGKDFLLLAGPTMDLDGTIALFRWKNALPKTRHSQQSLVQRKQIKRIMDIPHGVGENAGKDRAEGMTLVSNHNLMVVYDSPSPNRSKNKSDVMADLFRIKGNNKR